MKKYICWYVYQGMETEGHLNLEEPQSFFANSKSEALYKYLILRAVREKREPYHKTLEEYLKSGYHEGGWGFNVLELAQDEYCEEDSGWFKQYLIKYRVI